MDDLYLGLHHANWLTTAGVPAFISHTTLAQRKTLPQAGCRWALDSGGFTQLRDYGTWTIPPRQYVAAVRRYRDEIGHLDFASIQDWMCEPLVINGGAGRRGVKFAGTHLSVAEHQRRTVESALTLTHLDASLPWLYVVQGDTRDDYLRCEDLYAAAGINLAAQPRVGLGSVCRREGTTEAKWIILSLAPLRLHGFGVKATGLAKYGHRLVSADSMAWSDVARWEHIQLPGHPHKTCANCLEWALRWRRKSLAKIAAAEARGRQGDLFDPDEAWSAA